MTRHHDRHHHSYDFDTATYSLIIATTLLLLLMTRIWSVYRSIHQKNHLQSSTNIRRSVPMKTMVVLGSGGHTTEMLTLIKNLDQTRYAPLIYVVATTDTTSIRRLAAVDTSSNHHRKADVILKIPRSREVGQSYISSIWTTLWSFLFAIRIVLGVRPNLLLCNGPGTCLPIAVVTLILRILGLCEGRIVFVESFCRVTSLSLTGRLLYPIVDLFVVHWEQLQRMYPRSRLVSTFVSQTTTSSRATSMTDKQ